MLVDTGSVNARSVPAGPRLVSRYACQHSVGPNSVQTDGLAKASARLVERLETRTARDSSLGSLRTCRPRCDLCDAHMLNANPRRSTRTLDACSTLDTAALQTRHHSISSPILATADSQLNASSTPTLDSNAPRSTLDTQRSTLDAQR